MEKVGRQACSVWHLGSALQRLVGESVSLKCDPAQGSFLVHSGFIDNKTSVSGTATLYQSLQPSEVLISVTLSTHRG